MTYATLESLLAHYLQMAALDQEYAMRRVRYIAEKAPSLYKELPALLTAAMKSASPSPASLSAKAAPASAGSADSAACSPPRKP